MTETHGVKSALLYALRKHIILTLLTLTCLSLSIVISVLPPLLLANIIDSLTGGRDPGVEIVLFYFFLLLLEALLTCGKESLLAVLGEKMTHSLRSIMALKLYKLDAETLLTHKSGETVSLFSSDTDTLESLFSSGVISMFSDTVRIISIMYVIALKNRGLFLILLIILPIFALYTRHVQKNTLHSEIENRKAVAEASGEVPETVHNIRTIRNLSIEEFMEKRYGDSVKKSYKAIERTNFYDSVYSPIVLILNAFVVGAIMLLSASGNTSILTFFGMSAGTAVAIINYISSIFTPVESLGMELQTIESALAGMKRIDAFLNEKERVITEENHFVGNGSVSVENVTFGYKDKAVLENFSLEVKKGETVIITGRTGAGKSTLFKLLLGLYKPQKGRILISGLDANSIPDSERRKIICCVEQHFKRVPGTVKDQITLFDPYVTDQMVKDAIFLVELDEKVRNLPHGYETECTDGLFSEGEWELIAIARAVVSDPKVLLLDEVTASLDSGTEKIVLDALGKASKGRTVISISHRKNKSKGTKTVEIK